MKVSVIVAVKNEAERIGSCLDSVLSQTYKDYELVIVDGGSTDGTVEILESYVKRAPERIRLLFDPGLGPGYARNLGVKISKGEVLAFVDGDDEINHEYLASVVKHFYDPHVAGVFVKMVFKSEPKNWGKVQDAWRWMRWSKETMRFSVVLSRSVFDGVGGYNTKLVIGEDYDLYRRLERYVAENHLKFETETGAVIRSVSEDAPLKTFRHGVWFGKHLIDVVKVHPKYGSLILLWSLFNALLIPSILLLLLPFFTLISSLYLASYTVLWLTLIVKASMRKGGNGLSAYLLLTPFLQLWVSIAVLTGVAKSLFSPKSR